MQLRLSALGLVVIAAISAPGLGPVLAAERGETSPKFECKMTKTAPHGQTVHVRVAGKCPCPTDGSDRRCFKTHGIITEEQLSTQQTDSGHAGQGYNMGR